MVHDAVTTAMEHFEERQLEAARQDLAHRQAVQARRQMMSFALTPPLQPTAGHAAIVPLHPTVRALVEHVQQHYAEGILLKQLAAGFHLSPAYLSDLFSKTIGLPFKQYLTALRMEHAAQLLHEIGQSVKSVAAAVGHANPGRFRQAFKHWNGLPPRLARNHLHTDELIAPTSPQCR
jgi:YesN/AraC family two-component response regulator